MDKNELLAAMSDSYVKLNEQIGKMTDDELNAAFQFANDPKKFQMYLHHRYGGLL